MEAPSPWRPPSPLPERVETERVVIRAFHPDDATSMHAAIEADRASFLPWVTWARDDNRTVAECVFHIERFRRNAARATPTPDDFVLGIFDRNTGQVLGGTGLHRIDLAAHCGEIGYWMRGDRRNQGLTSEAVAVLISWGFRAQPAGWGFRRIIIACSANNVASATVPRKLGIRQECYRVKDRWVEGLGFEDSLEFAILADEWDADKSRRVLPSDLAPEEVIRR